MPNNDKVQDPLDQPLMSTGSEQPGFKKDTKNSKLAAKPKIGDTIVGDDGIKGRMR